MGDQHNGCLMGFPNIKQQILQLHFCERIKRAEPLVEQQDPGRGYKRTGNGHPLRHAAGKLLGIKMLTALEPNAFQVFSSQGALRLPVALEPENDIVQNRFPRQQARLLKDEPCRASNAIRRLPIDENVAFISAVKAGQGAQQCAFSHPLVPSRPITSPCLALNDTFFTAALPSNVRPTFLNSRPMPQHLFQVFPIRSCQCSALASIAFNTQSVSLPTIANRTMLAMMVSGDSVFCPSTSR